LAYCSGVTLGLPFQTRRLDEPLGNQSVTAFGQDDELGLDRLTLDVVRLLVPFLIETLVDELDAGGTVAVEHDMVGREAGQDFDALLAGDGAQPLGELADGDGIVAMVEHLAPADAELPRRLEQAEDIERHTLAQQEHDVVLVDHVGQHVLGLVALAPVGLGGIEQGMQRLFLEDGTGEIVVAQIGGLVDDADVNIRLNDLQLNGGGQPGRASANDQDRHFVELVVFRHLLFLSLKRIGPIRSIGPIGPMLFTPRPEPAPTAG
jgi:hypothetical protein